MFGKSRKQVIMLNMNNRIERKKMIPKIIHYCWFGQKNIPSDLQECINSWNKLEGYTIMRWDDTNCSFDENEFIIKAYKEKKYAFISDFYRLKALYQYGGFYLDTDVWVNRSFDDLLKYPLVLNFIFDCSIGSAVIGTTKNNRIIKDLLDLYYITTFQGNASKKRFLLKDGKLCCKGFETNNFYFTSYILKNYKNFKLNNTFQDMGDFVIFPKELFEIGKISGKHYAIHLCAGEWRSNKVEGNGIKSIIKSLLAQNKWIYQKVQILVRKKRYKKMMKKIPFYEAYVLQKRGEEIPDYY